MHWKTLNILHNWYQFSGAEQLAKLVHYTTQYPPCHGSQTLVHMFSVFEEFLLPFRSGGLGDSPSRQKQNVLSGVRT